MYCPSPPSRVPIDLLRVMASGEAPEVGDAPDGGCVPMDGKWIVFSGEAGQWGEERGGNFWGYGNAYEFARESFSSILCWEGDCSAMRRRAASSGPLR